MIPSPALRLVAAIAGLMGAGGVGLAAMSAHIPDATRLAAASSMLLFHAAAVLAVLVSRDRLLHPAIGTAAACGLALGAVLFALDLSLRQFAGRGLFPMAAPTGGTIMIASWLAVVAAAAWPRRA
jgi:uncharacterized membrane protein YgdD (TMEM256/DUF423 family)